MITSSFLFFTVSLFATLTAVCIAATVPLIENSDREGRQMNMGPNGVNNGFGGAGNTIIGSSNFGPGMGMGGFGGFGYGGFPQGMGGGVNYGPNGVNNGFGGTGNTIIAGTNFGK